MENSVAAVIVTYHPTAAMVENIPAVLPQVQGLVVVDNGSSAEPLQLLRTARLTNEFELIENKENRGIADALNQGVLWAKRQGYTWVVLFDQDSTITGNFIQRMLASWEQHPQRERIASMHPRYVDPRMGTESLVYRANDGGPIVSMTSGAMFPVWIFDKIGLFASEYFIEKVDTEYGLRSRAAGYLIADSREAVLLHSIGHPQPIVIFGSTFWISNHNSTRRYYMTRNRLVVYRKYLRTFPRWVLLLAYWEIRETMKCLIAERDRAGKFRSVVLGIYDGLVGKMGRRDEP